MSAADLGSAEEFAMRYHANYRTDGHGIGQTTVHMPCPFCAAPDWMNYRIADGLPDGDHRCDGCGRTARIVCHRGSTTTNLELVQTGGGDPPVWLEPPPRRIGDDDDQQ